MVSFESAKVSGLRLLADSCNGYHKPFKMCSAQFDLNLEIASFVSKQNMDESAKIAFSGAS